MNTYELKRHRLTEESIGGKRMRVFAGRPGTLRELLAETVQRYGAREGFVSGDRRWTFADFGKKAARLAGCLQLAHGARKGDRIAILMGTDIEYALSVFAVTSFGGIAVPLNSRFSSEELAYELENSRSSVVLVDERFWPTVEPLRSRLPSVRAWFVRGDHTPEGTRPYSELLEGPSGEPPAAHLEEHDVAILMFTSGTTGNPKAAMQTHRGVIHACMLMDDITCSDADSDRMLNVLPMFHSAGMIMTSIAAVFMGIPCIYVPDYSTAYVLAVLAQERISLMVHVPTVYGLLANHPDFAEYDLRHFRLGVIGGAPKSRALIEALRSRLPWAEFVDTYGMTETHTLDFVLEHRDMMEHGNSVGRVVPLEDVRIVGADGRECGVGEPGEITLSSPKLVAGYWNDPDATADVLREDWLYTGDWGAIDENGFVCILDRIKDMINRGGEKIASAEVEGVLRAHPQVAEAAAVGAPDAVFGEVVKAYVIPEEGGRLDAAELQEFCAGRLADYKVPRYVEIVPDLPRNKMGKILKRELR